MAAKLVAEEGILKGLVLSLEDGDHWVIGRDPDACQLLVEDPSASRKHLVCRTTPKGILVENLSETNPTQVNEQEVKEPRLLHNGDAVKIGDGTFRFYAEAAAHLFKDEETGEKELPLNNHPSEEAVLPKEQKATEIEPETAKSETSDISEILPSEVEPDAKQPEPTAMDEENIAPPLSDEAIDGEFPEVEQEDVAETQQPEIKELEEKYGPADNEPEQSSQQQPKQDIEPNMELQDKEKVDHSIENQEISHETSLPDDLSDDGEPRHDSIFDEEPSDKHGIAEINFGLLDTGRWLLKVISGPNNGAEFSMQTGNSYIIGTDPNACDIVFHDTSVSRQHTRITVSQDDTLIIEDLKSRNGTLVDGEKLEGKLPLAGNSLVAVGTTSFVVFDREGEMQTIISPLMPSIVKALQAEEPKKEAEHAAPVAAAAPIQEAVKTPEPQHNTNLGAFILIGILTGLFVIVGIGTSTLFKSEPIHTTQLVDPSKALSAALDQFPSVKYTFNPNTGQLLLVGHVLTTTDKSQLMYALQGLPFIKSLDDSGVIIDEYVWREINQVLEKNPDWKGINVMATTPGHFVVSGYLQTRSQADRLSEYLSANFPYPDLLEKRTVVDQEVLASINTILQSKGLRSVVAKLDNGEVTLTGGIPTEKLGDIVAVVGEIKEIRGVRSVRNSTSGQAAEQSVINISDKYEVTGISSQSGTMSVVINGRILMKGDVLDGMAITAIQTNTVYLERDGTRYRIDFNR